MYDFEFAALGERNWDSAQQERYNDLTALLDAPGMALPRRIEGNLQIMVLNLSGTAKPDRAPVAVGNCRLFTGQNLWLEAQPADYRDFWGIALAPAAPGDAVPVQFSGVISVYGVSGSTPGAFLLPEGNGFCFTDLPTRARVLAHDAASGETRVLLTTPAPAYHGYFMLNLLPEGTLHVVDGSVYDGKNLISGGVNRCYVNNQLYEVPAYEYPEIVAQEGDVYLKFEPATESFSFGFGSLPANTDTECYALLGQIKYAGNNRYRALQRHTGNVLQMWWSRLCL